MRSYKSSLKLLVAGVILAGLWFGAAHVIGGRSSFPAPSQTAAVSPSAQTVTATKHAAQKTDAPSAYALAAAPEAGSPPLPPHHDTPSHAELARRWAPLRADSAPLREGALLSFPLLSGETLLGRVNLAQTETGGRLLVGGPLLDAQGRSAGHFSLARADDGGLAGLLVPSAGEVAYTLERDAAGRTLLIERERGAVLCPALPPVAASGTAPSGATAAVPVLSSRPSAPAVIYLDFDGETVTDVNWNGGATITAAASGFTADQITEVWQRVSEDYAPFNVDVTTDLARYNAVAAGSRMRCIVTPTSDWYTATAGGVAYVGSWRLAGVSSSSFSNTTPCWAFINHLAYKARSTAEAVSHEIGHTLGLSHDGLMDSKGTTTKEYYEGRGTGATSWAPIMGVGYYVNLVQWSKGDYTDGAYTANNTEDDLAIITSSNHVAYLADDAGNTTDAAAPIAQPTATTISQSGLIERTSDTDFYRFTSGDGDASFTLAPAALAGLSNLDARLSLYDSAGQLVAESDPADSLLPAISTTLSAGLYYLAVTGVGEGSPPATGYSAYGSLGVYTITGTINIEPPVIVTQPEGLVVAHYSDASLTVAATGSGLSYQWSKNGKAIPGATGATLDLPAITLPQAGTYTCVLTTDKGASASTNAAKIVVYDPAPPIQTANPGTTFTTPPIVAGPVDSGSYQWSLDGSPLTNSLHVAGADTALLTITNITSADNGTYTLAAKFNGATVPVGPITFAMRLPPAVSFTPPGSFHTSLGSTVTFPLVTDNGPYLYRYIGLPKGLSYNATTAAVTGRTTAAGTFPVILLTTDPYGLFTVLYINLVIDPLPAAFVGVFNGTVDRDPALNQTLGGALTFTTTAGGLITGRLTQGATTYAFTGSLDGAPGADATATITIPRKGLSALSLHLDLPLDDSGATGTLNATVGVAAWHKAATTPTYTGNYTFALETPAGAGWPAGYSTGTLAVSPAGAVTWTLQPADGTVALKGTTTLSADGTLPLFAPMITPAGSFLGFFSLPVTSMPAAPITGSVTWLRGATSSALYANSAGFGPLSMNLHGGRYTPPGSLVLGLPIVANNANLQFGGNDVDLGSQAAGLASFTFTLASQNKVVLPAVNPTALKLTVNASTGAFSGTFTLTDPSIAKPGSSVKRSEKFSGVLLLQDDVGAGFFVLPPIPGSGNGTRSGSVIFSQSAP